MEGKKKFDITKSIRQFGPKKNGEKWVGANLQDNNNACLELSRKCDIVVNAGHGGGTFAGSGINEGLRRFYIRLIYSNEDIKGKTVNPENINNNVFDYLLTTHKENQTEVNTVYKINKISKIIDYDGKECEQDNLLWFPGDTENDHKIPKMLYSVGPNMRDITNDYFSKNKNYTDPGSKKIKKTPEKIRNELTTAFDNSLYNSLKESFEEIEGYIKDGNNHIDENHPLTVYFPSISTSIFSNNLSATNVKNKSSEYYIDRGKIAQVINAMFILSFAKSYPGKIKFYLNYDFYNVVNDIQKYLDSKTKYNMDGTDQQGIVAEKDVRTYINQHNNGGQFDNFESFCGHIRDYHPLEEGVLGQNMRLIENNNKKIEINNKIKNNKNNKNNNGINNAKKNFVVSNTKLDSTKLNKFNGLWQKFFKIENNKIIPMINNVKQLLADPATFFDGIQKDSFKIDDLVYYQFNDDIYFKIERGTSLEKGDNKSLVSITFVYDNKKPSNEKTTLNISLEIDNRNYDVMNILSVNVNVLNDNPELSIDEIKKKSQEKQNNNKNNYIKKEFFVDSSDCDFPEITVNKDDNEKIIDEVLKKGKELNDKCNNEFKEEIKNNVNQQPITIYDLYEEAKNDLEKKYKQYDQCINELNITDENVKLILSDYEKRLTIDYKDGIGGNNCFFYAALTLLYSEPFLSSKILLYSRILKRDIIKYYEQKAGVNKSPDGFKNFFNIIQNKNLNKYTDEQVLQAMQNYGMNVTIDDVKKKIREYNEQYLWISALSNPTLDNLRQLYAYCNRLGQQDDPAEVVRKVIDFLVSNDKIKTYTTQELEQCGVHLNGENGGFKEINFDKAPTTSTLPCLEQTQNKINYLPRKKKYAPNITPQVIYTTPVRLYPLYFFEKINDSRFYGFDQTDTKKIRFDDNRMFSDIESVDELKIRKIGGVDYILQSFSVYSGTGSAGHYYHAAMDENKYGAGNENGDCTIEYKLYSDAGLAKKDYKQIKPSDITNLKYIRADLYKDLFTERATIKEQLKNKNGKIDKENFDGYCYLLDKYEKQRLQQGPWTVIENKTYYKDAIYKEICDISKQALINFASIVDNVKKFLQTKINKLQNDDLKQRVKSLLETDIINNLETIIKENKTENIGHVIYCVSTIMSILDDLINDLCLDYKDDENKIFEFYDFSKKKQLITKDENRLSTQFFETILGISKQDIKTVVKDINKKLKASLELEKVNKNVYKKNLNIKTGEEKKLKIVKSNNDETEEKSEESEEDETQPYPQNQFDTQKGLINTTTQPNKTNQIITTVPPKYTIIQPNPQNQKKQLKLGTQYQPNPQNQFDTQKGLINTTTQPNKTNQIITTVPPKYTTEPPKYTITQPNTTNQNPPKGEDDSEEPKEEPLKEKDYGQPKGEDGLKTNFIFFKNTGDIKTVDGTKNTKKSNNGFKNNNTGRFNFPLITKYNNGIKYNNNIVSNNIGNYNYGSNNYSNYNNIAKNSPMTAESIVRNNNNFLKFHKMLVDIYNGKQQNQKINTNINENNKDNQEISNKKQLLKKDEWTWEDTLLTIILFFLAFAGIAYAVYRKNKINNNNKEYDKQQKELLNKNNINNLDEPSYNQPIRM